MNNPNQPDLVQRITMYKMDRAVTRMNQAMIEINHCRRTNPHNERMETILLEIEKVTNKLEAELNTIRDAHEHGNISANDLDPGFQ